MISRTMMTVFVRFLHTYFVFLLITPYLENEYKIHQITSYDKDAKNASILQMSGTLN
jgi:hypothetical protein